MIRRLLPFMALALAWAATAALAQAPAALIADSVTVDPSGRLTATGDVEVFYEDTRLRAAEVIYDRATDRLTVVGPITIVEADGTVLLADEARLSPGLRDGLLTSARIVLDQQLQRAANQIARVGGRYVTLDRVVASSCRVCAENPRPLWEIRARRVIQDMQERRLYFEGASLRMLGVPVLYLPRLRIPDPTVDRATGALIPEIQSVSGLSTGVKLPYFIALGDHADVTLTPYISAVTATLEFRYRQEIANGRLDAVGALTNDDLEGARGYLFANAEYQLPRGFVATAQAELVSDPGYLFLYDYSEKDRLTNEIAVTRVRAKDRFRASATEFRTLREDEIPIRDELPDRFLEVSYLREAPRLAFFGGEATVRIDAAALNRPSPDDIVGRDVSRLGAGYDWHREEVIGPGIVARAEVGVRADVFNVGQDSTFPTTLTRVAPRAAVELRWPFARTATNGARDLIEPVLRIDLSETGGDAVPLEDSRVATFDEASLFRPSRYPGIDGAEDGTRAAIGVTWRRETPGAWRGELTAGRIVALDGPLGFAEGTGLDGDSSDWLLAGRLSLGDNLWVASRALLDDDLAVTLTETRLDWFNDRARVASSYVQADPAPAEDRLEELGEWSLEGAYGLTDNWTASADWRYDFVAGRAARAGFGLDYVNECIRVALSLSRRFATSSSVTPTTDFGFSVSLLGVGAGGNRGKTSTCGG